MGRKNWLFSDQPVGAYTSAVIYSLVQTAKLNGVNPYYYLRYVLEKMSSYPICENLTEQELADLMPWSSKVAEAIQEYGKEKDKTAWTANWSYVNCQSTLAAAEAAGVLFIWE